jgi:hypothetical protein
MSCSVICSIGFSISSACKADRSAWRDFLTRRSRAIGEFNADHPSSCVAPP